MTEQWEYIKRDRFLWQPSSGIGFTIGPNIGLLNSGDLDSFAERIRSALCPTPEPEAGAVERPDPVAVAGLIGRLERHAADFYFAANTRNVPEDDPTRQNVLAVMALFRDAATTLAEYRAALASVSAPQSDDEAGRLRVELAECRRILMNLHAASVSAPPDGDLSAKLHTIAEGIMRKIYGEDVAAWPNDLCNSISQSFGIVAQAGYERGRAVSAPPGWQSIETAPRDGTHVLVVLDGNLPPTTAHWFGPADLPGLRSGGWYLSVQQHEGPRVHPTHWQRLPSKENG